MKPAPKPVKQKHGHSRKVAVKMSRPKKYYEGKLDRLNRELVFWRDSECVEKSADGCHCGGGWELGHIVRRSDSAWLKLLFWNLAKQCFEHNRFHGDPLLHRVTGDCRMGALREELLAHRKEEPDAEELKRRIRVVEYLLANRPASYTQADLEDLGYYGPLNEWAKAAIERAGAESE